MKQTTLFDLEAFNKSSVPVYVDDPSWDEWELRVGAQVSNTTPVETLVGAQVSDITEKSAPQHDTHWIERYWVERAGNKYWYYRYCWMTGRKKNRCYLGAVRSQLASKRKKMVEDAISEGCSPQEIEELIRQQRG